MLNEEAGLAVVPPAALLWDVDGTLIDSTSLILDALDFIYRKHYGRTLPPDGLRAIIGTPLKRQIRVFGEPEALGADEDEVTEDFILYYEAHRDQERILAEVTAILIEGRRRRVPTALVTSKNDEELANTLPRLGIVDWIDAVVSADAVSRPKPDPEGMRLALSRLGVPPTQAGECVYIGDTVHDIKAAKGAGIQSIAVTWGAGTRTLLAAEAPTALCDTPEQLYVLLFP